MSHKLSNFQRIALKKPVRHGQNLEHGAKHRKYLSGNTPDPPKGGQKCPKSLKWSRGGSQRVTREPQGAPKGSPKGSQNGTLENNCLPKPKTDFRWLTLPKTGVQGVQGVPALVFRTF